jgi:hypothetical protein
VSTVTEPMTRRAYLLAAIQADGRPLTVQRAEHLMADSPWPTARRNTLRKDLRALSARGQLLAEDAAGRRTYRLIPATTGEDGRS